MSIVTEQCGPTPPGRLRRRDILLLAVGNLGSRNVLTGFAFSKGLCRRILLLVVRSFHTSTVNPISSHYLPATIFCSCQMKCDLRKTWYVPSFDPIGLQQTFVIARCEHFQVWHACSVSHTHSYAFMPGVNVRSSKKWWTRVLLLILYVKLYCLLEKQLYRVHTVKTYE